MSFSFIHNPVKYHTTQMITNPPTITTKISRQDQMKAKREAMRQKKDAGNPKFGEETIFSYVFMQLLDIMLHGTIASIDKTIVFKCIVLLREDK